MSKMPAKKKSCFQITSVTQAQVAAIGATDDTESLEDPDESRAEDVSSEMYDEPASEEAPNNAGEPEAPSHIPHFAVLSVNPLGEFRKTGVSGPAQGGQQPPAAGIGAAVTPLPAQQVAPLTSSPGPAVVSVNVSQPASAPSPGPPHPSASAVSCTSRFRVIKLDHGTGEPFRRGRWMCTEFYEKESEGNRTADRHVGATLDSAADRDSGLGHTGGSAVASAQASGSSADVALSSSRMDSSVQQNFITRQHVGSGSGPQIALSSVPVPLQTQSVMGSVQPAAQNGLPQSAIHMQKSPILPQLAQTQAYPFQQLSMGHHLTAQNQTEYYQPGLPTGQSLSVSSGPQTAGQATSPAAPAASGGVSIHQLGDVAVGGSILSGPAAPGQTAGMGTVLVGGSTLQQSVSQYAATGQPKPLSLHPASSGVQNVPAIAVSSGVPPTVPTAMPSASSAAMPKVTTSSLPPGQTAHSKTTGALGAPGLLAAGFGQVEGGGVRRSDGVVKPMSSGKDLMKPLMPESLQLAAPTVNSLFGIHLPVDGDEDSASGTNIVAIDNKIEQAMDLVKSHLMYAVREEVEVLKEQIKELYERNSVLERENAVLKSLANSEQLSQLPAHPPPPLQPQQQQQGLNQPTPALAGPPPQQTPPQLDPSQQQPNVTSA
ncbi:TSC22 domain family protein 2-like isoform X2 [Nerophis ophidion]|uniref:TSC22 domain family protein 2-like isoform X2 n=1 Tax=Nerophis ophidion TaxID=159077 RepID=UPI002ADFBE11|nr:TSC22 domain family protein 2-like isoform X2 [Nerophis ophidion]